ncbi:DNA polymerase III subunit gamma/tau [Limosilactobacillus mucosae]|uniref:DNA polymerase III subunit gamma/tau n=1 Tax=Limosilactobacillus mucosae TaxID=97478 RepID=UPI003995426E
MSYQALYRVWRPQRFDEIVGQQVVTQTLKNAIITKQISHAYLFAGPRGTGKTSAAKIFAKAINCHHQQDGEPCNECEICQAITNGQLGDVIEIDAASNNGVEEIRDIRDKAKYAPTQADYKVYIIDEVHMLSTGAFNALLKTLEEPPANVIFILATTEPHKIPLTIISRVQRFDFRRISAQDAFERMQYILDQKHVVYENDALWVIANAAEGGMRDALSILDQVLSFSDNQVKLDDALLVTGSVTKQLLKKYFDETISHQSAAALHTMKEILDQGKDGQRFIEDLISFIRDVLLYQESPQLVNVAGSGLKETDFQQLSQAASADELYQMIDELNEIQEEMRFTTHPDVYLEVLTVKLSQIKPQVDKTSASDPRLSQTIGQLQQEIQQLQSAIAGLRQTGSSMAPRTVRRSGDTVGNKIQPKMMVKLDRVYPILEHATKQNLRGLQEIWGDLLNMLETPQRALINTSQPVAASPQGVVVSFDSSFLLQRANSGSLAADMEAGLQRLSGNEMRVAFVPMDQWPKIRHNYLAEHGYLNKDKAGTDKKTSSAQTAPATPIKTDPLVDKAKQMFGDLVKIEDN